MRPGKDPVQSEDGEGMLRERIMILDRFLDGTQLEDLGAKQGIEWFKDNDIGFHNRGVAAEILAENFDQGKELQRTLNEFELEEPLFPWFLGRYYTVEWLEDRVVVSEESDEKRRDRINKEVAERAKSLGVFRPSLKGSIENGYYGLSELYANVQFYKDRYTEAEPDEECTEELDDLSGIEVTREDRTGYRLRIPLELVQIIHRGASGVLPAEKVTVDSEVFGLRGDPQAVFLSELDGKRVSVDEEVSIDDSDIGHGYMRVQDTEPDGPVEITNQTEIQVETKDDRASVMSDEVPKGKRISIGMADVVVEVLRENGGDVRREGIVDLVDERLNPDMDVYHLMDKSHLGRSVQSGLRRLIVRGEVYETDEGYRLTSNEETRI